MYSEYVYILFHLLHSTHSLGNKMLDFRYERLKPLELTVHLPPCLPFFTPPPSFFHSPSSLPPPLFLSSPSSLPIFPPPLFLSSPSSLPIFPPPPFLFPPLLPSYLSPSSLPIFPPSLPIFPPPPFLSSSLLPLSLLFKTKTQTLRRFDHSSTESNEHLRIFHEQRKLKTRISQYQNLFSANNFQKQKDIWIRSWFNWDAVY